MFGVAVALAVVGVLMIVSHFVNPPPRYGGPIRIDAETPSRPGMGKVHLGVGMICIAAGLVTAAALIAGH